MHLAVMAALVVRLVRPVTLPRWLVPPFGCGTDRGFHDTSLLTSRRLDGQGATSAELVQGGANSASDIWCRGLARILLLRQQYYQWQYYGGGGQNHAR